MINARQRPLPGPGGFGARTDFPARASPLPCPCASKAAVISAIFCRRAGLKDAFLSFGVLAITIPFPVQAGPHVRRTLRRAFGSKATRHTQPASNRSSFMLAGRDPFRVSTFVRRLDDACLTPAFVAPHRTCLTQLRQIAVRPALPCPPYFSQTGSCASCGINPVRLPTCQRRTVSGA